MKKVKKLSIAIAVMLLMIPIRGVMASDSDAADVRTIEIVGMDNMKYDVEEIVASPGERIRIVFRVVSNMPPTAMKHNIAIVDQGVDLDGFVMASIMARDNEYIAPDWEDQVVAFTLMIGGGETSEIEFTVPEQPGEYVYVCTFPGHYQAGMVGILRVR